MNCPYCNKEMAPGTIQAPDSHANYWLPDNTKSSDIGILLSRKSVEKYGGVVLGEVRKVGFCLPKGQPVATVNIAAYYLQLCNVHVVILYAALGVGL